MYESLIDALRQNGVDTEGALRRFVGNTQLYGKFLKSFRDDENYSQIAPAFDRGDYEAALTAVHTLKGISGNLGMNRLFAACSRTVELIRAGENEKAAGSCTEVKEAYEEICSLIENN
jgi:HPt (histidine-containing phosphotransfer) domain-containing protein